jgi:hypothetical protein
MSAFEKCLNAVGLVFVMLGVIIILVWGARQTVFRQWLASSTEPGTVFDDNTKLSELIDEARLTRRMRAIMPRVGLAMISIGFVVQLVSMWE